MSFKGKKEPIILFLGDILVFLASLWLTLWVRYFEFPQGDTWYDHVVPFSFLFVVWVVIFMIAGLYRKHTVLFKRRLPGVILRAQIINILIAATFFFLIPYFGIAPKTNLFIYLVISFLFVVFWRIYIYQFIDSKRKRSGLLIGSGVELVELQSEINENSSYDLFFEETLDLDKLSSDNIVSEAEETIKRNNISVIAIDATDERVVPALPVLYSLIFLGIEIVDISKVYENIFERVPLSFVKQNWLLDNVGLSTKVVYDSVKRLFDIAVGVFIGIPAIILYPFVYLAIKLDDGGSIFYYQERVGANGETVRLSKFRSMSQTEKEKITRIGSFLRKTRIDELPQLLSVLKGDLSLIGPRPETPELAALYERRIPYYNVRHLIKPGLSGWAQIHQDNPPKYGVQYDETALKLSYDLYYVKHRSVVLDFQIALQTVKTLLSRTGL
jgi:exopolysaccharide biosynthesis polyprenyl glycosylphosphotransferase